LLADGRWLSPGTPASSTTKADRHDIAEILLKVALKHQPTKFRFFGQTVSEEKNLKISANQKQESTVAAMFVNRLRQMHYHYRGPSIDASYQVSDQYGVGSLPVL
jgi:lipopolysaccharide biosynthesis protein